MNRGWLPALAILVFVGLTSSSGKQNTLSKSPVQWAADLGGKDNNAVEKAIRELTKLGPKAKPAVPAILQALKPKPPLYPGLIGVLKAIGPTAIPELTTALGDKKPLVRGVAAYVLGEFGPEAKSSFVPLKKTLNDANEYVRSNSAEAIGKIGVADGESIAALGKLLAENSTFVRRAAAKALAYLGPKAKAAAPALIARLEDKDERVRQFAAAALGRIGASSLPLLTGALRHAQPIVRSQAATILGDLGWQARSSVPILAKSLADSDRDVRISALISLGKFGVPSKTAVADMAKLLQDKDAGVRKFAAISLGMLGMHAQKATPNLAKALQDADPSVRSHSAFALGGIGPAAKPAISPLKKMLGDKDTMNRITAAYALWRIERRRQTVIPALKMGLKSKDRFVSAKSAEVLAEMGPHAADVAPLVLDAFKKGRLERDDTLKTLTELGVKAVPAITSFLERERGDHQEFAFQVLQQLGPKAGIAVPVLRRLLRDRDRGIFHQAARTLGALGVAAAAAAPDLAAALADSDVVVSRNAAEALGELGPAAKAAVPALVKTFRSDKRADVRYAALLALQKLGPAAASAVPILVAELEKETNSLQHNIVGTLSAIGPPAIPAAPLLRKLLNAKEPNLRLTTAVALAKIAGEKKQLLAEVREALQSKVGMIRHQAVALLAFENELFDDKEAVPLLIRQLGDPQGYAAQQLLFTASMGLEKRGPKAKSAIPALQALLKSNDRPTRIQAAAALWAVSKDSRRVLPVLIGELTSPPLTGNAYWRVIILRVLAEIGPAAKDAATHLHKYLDHPDRRIRRAARNALQSINSVPGAFNIPIIDLDNHRHRQVIVDREKGQYLGHPTTVLLEDGKTMLCVYPKGHGRGAIVYKRSTDGGKTWSKRLPTPKSWATSKEVPTMYRVVDAKGVRRLIMFSGLYPIRMAVSEDDGESWSELKAIGDYGGIVAMGCCFALKTGPGHYMAMFHDDGRFFTKKGKRTNTMTLFTTVSMDGGLTWSFPKTIYKSAAVHLCEPGVIRSPDGKQLAVLLRENRRVKNSHVIFSNDEGKTWTKPRELPRSLTGDRHTAQYGPDGRLFISFRDRTPKTWKSPTAGDWVGWVGTFEDIVNGRPGQYRVRLKDNTRGADCAYPGVEILPDGTFVTTTYGHWDEGQPPYILCVRFTLAELDRLAKNKKLEN